MSFIKLKRLIYSLFIFFRNNFLFRFFPIHKRAVDRFLLENAVFPFINQVSRKRLLFIGVEIYTCHYQQLLKSCDFYTIDQNPELSRFGAQPLSTNHIVADARLVNILYPPSSFDFVIANGLYGYGSEYDDLIAICISISSILRQDGLLILGINASDHLIDSFLSSLSYIYHPVENTLLSSLFRLSVYDPSRNHKFIILAKS